MKIRNIIYACLITSTVVCMEKTNKCYNLAQLRLNNVPYDLIKTHKGITELNLSNNEITGIDIDQLPPSIKKINLSNNKITKIDLVLATLLANPDYSINVDNNPLDKTSQELLTRSTQEYYDALATQQVSHNTCQWIMKTISTLLFGNPTMHSNKD